MISFASSAVGGHRWAACCRNTGSCASNNAKRSFKLEGGRMVARCLLVQYFPVVFVGVGVAAVALLVVIVAADVSGTVVLASVLVFLGVDAVLVVRVAEPLN